MIFDLKLKRCVVAWFYHFPYRTEFLLGFDYKKTLPHPPIQIQLNPANWYIRPNPVDRINRKLNDQKKRNDQTIKKQKNKKTKDQKYCFVPNIRSNLHSVNFNMLVVVLLP